MPCIFIMSIIARFWLLDIPIMARLSADDIPIIIFFIIMLCDIFMCPIIVCPTAILDWEELCEVVVWPIIVFPCPIFWAEAGVLAKKGSEARAASRAPRLKVLNMVWKP